MKIEDKILTDLLKNAETTYESGCMRLDLDNKDYSICVSLTDENDFDTELWNDDKEIILTPDQEQQIYDKLSDLLKVEIDAEETYAKENSDDPWENYGVENGMFI